VIDLPSISTYFGGKGASGVHQTIINHQPPHQVYIEPFLGGGYVFRKKKPAKENIGIELNKETFYQWCALTPGVKFDSERAYIVRTIEESKFTVINMNAIDYLRSIQAKRFFNVDPKQVLIYLDPPYPNTTRKSNTKYQHELFDNEHEELLKIIVKLPYLVQISTYDNELYKRYLKKMAPGALHQH